MNNFSYNLLNIPIIMYDNPSKLVKLFHIIKIHTFAEYVRNEILAPEPRTTNKLAHEAVFVISEIHTHPAKTIYTLFIK